MSSRCTASASTSAETSAAGASSDTAIIPRRSGGLNSTRSDTACVANSSGAKSQASGQTSYTIGPGFCVCGFQRRTHSRSSRAAGVSARSSRARSAWSIVIRRVTSYVPTNFNCPLPKTICAASGSMRILNSAKGRVGSHPMQTIPFSCAARSGWSRSRIPALVIGPIVASHTSPGCASITRRKSAWASPQPGAGSASPGRTAGY